MLRRSDPPPKTSDEQSQGLEQPVRSLIVMGASGGGRAAIGTVLKDLSHDIPAAIVVMLHVAPDSKFDMGKWFRQFGHIELVNVGPRERLREGVVFVAPPGQSLTVEEGEVCLKAVNRQGIVANTINDLFRSAAKTYGDRSIGVILSGCLADGAKGLRAVKEAGGLTIIQDPAEAEYRDMPANALAQVPDATFKLNAKDIGLTLDLLARRNSELETGASSAVRLLKERIALFVRLIDQSKGNEATHRYLCTELTSLRAELHALELLLSEPQ